MSKTEITLRDHMASLCIAPAIAKFEHWDRDAGKSREQAIAEYAYKIADAMLIARDKGAK